MGCHRRPNISTRVFLQIRRVYEGLLVVLGSSFALELEIRLNRMVFKRLHAGATCTNMELRKMSNAENMFEDKHGNDSMPLDLEECRKSNLLLTGCNQQGKSLTAMQICDVLMANNWQILCMDSVGVWKEKSSVPTFFTVSEKTMKYVLPKRESMIFDISMLLPSYQREFIEAILNDVWQYRVKQKPKHWCLIVLEEAHQYMRNLRGLVSQSLMRICSVGANHGI